MLSNNSKMLTLNQVAAVADEWRRSNKKIVLVTGVFDLLHAEHQAFLQAAALEGDTLLVGIESDARVRLLKGPGRPINSQEERQKKIAQMSQVCGVFVLPEAFSKPAEHKKLIQEIRPDILAVSEHSPHQDKKAAIVAAFGGKLKVVLKHNPVVSTTKILEGLA